MNSIGFALARSGSEPTSGSSLTLWALTWIRLAGDQFRAVGSLPRFQKLVMDILA